MKLYFTNTRANRLHQNYSKPRVADQKAPESDMHIKEIIPTKITAWYYSGASTTK